MDRAGWEVTYVLVVALLVGSDGVVLEALQHALDIPRGVLEELVVAVENDEGNLAVAQH